MIILGIDPGTAITGFGVVERTGSSCRALGFGCIRTESGTPESERLVTIHRRIEEIVHAHSPQALAIERLYFNKNVGSALAVGQARGVAILAAAMHGIPVVEYTPSAVKAAVTGQGRATKEQVGYMIRAILALREVPSPDDVADALAVALCHAFRADGEQRIREAAGGSLP